MRSALAVVGGAALSLSLVACAGSSSTTVTLDQVAAERTERADERVETLLNTYADYLTGRWPELQLPDTSVERWLDAGEWRTSFETCAREYSGLTVRTDPSIGVHANPPPRTAEQLRDFEVSIYLCQGRFPPPNLARNEPGGVEIAWVTQYARIELLACLRRQGVIAPPLGTEPFAIVSGGSTPGWDPYVNARGDAGELRRVQALCPHPSTILSQLLPAGSER